MNLNILYHATSFNVMSRYSMSYHVKHVTTKLNNHIQCFTMVELDEATVATFDTQNVATLSNFNPLKFTIYMLSFTIQSSTYLYI